MPFAEVSERYSRGTYGGVVLGWDGNTLMDAVELRGDLSQDNLRHIASKGS
jgi:hypothetical protein